MSLLQILALSASLVLSTIGLTAFLVNKYKSFRRNKKYSPRQKRKYWAKQYNSSKSSPSRKVYAKKRLKELSK